ncbi:uncharacterized protein LOC125377396 [Haliotis rufescens]|uniref:uncharacterized protein LOC125377396 n=1 Tax=Haliotis rufescens TaxID=6454 RepID=UPI00201F05F4|nr:uncharacterized protein LOC125377396 [Haliotis rufescens]
MNLCDYCGDEIFQHQRVIVYHKDVDVRYVTQQDCIPVDFECVTVTVCGEGDNIKYLKKGSLLPEGFQRVSVSVRDWDVNYAWKQDLRPKGFEQVSVYSRNGAIKYARKGDIPPTGFYHVSVYAKNEEIKYEREGRHIPVGYEEVAVYVKTEDILYTRQGETVPTGSEHADVYVKDKDITQVKCLQVKEAFHTECLEKHIPRRDEAVRKFLKNVSPKCNVLSTGLHVKYLFGVGKEKQDKPRKKKEKRDCKAAELLRKVSALRNSNSGYILVHFVGLAPGDSFTGAFDEFADPKLHDLIQDGKQFCDVYRKETLKSHCACKDFGDFLVLYVGAASTVTTSRFNTKTTFDDCIIDIPAATLKTFVRERKAFKETFHTIPGVTHADDLLNVRENRSLQLKSNFEQKEGDQALAEYIIKNLKLAEYISAFTKTECGGSYLYGVHEENCFLEGYGYETKVIRIQPVVLRDRTAFKDTLEDNIGNLVLVCDYDGNEVSPDPNIFQVQFIPSTAAKKECDPRVNCESGNHGHGDVDPVVVHVSARPVSGIVFYDKQGPLAYRYDKQFKLITRINIKDWVRALTRRRETPE